MLQDAKLNRSSSVNELYKAPMISDCWAVGDVSGAVQGPGTWTGHVDLDSHYLYNCVRIDVKSHILRGDLCWGSELR